MKKYLPLLILLLSIISSQAISQSEISDNATYQKIIPNLKVIESSIKFSDNDIKLNTLHQVIEKSNKKHHVLLSKRISYDSLTKYLGKSSLFDYSNRKNLYHGDQKGIIGSLTIKTQVLDISKSIWLPEANITIHAEKIILHGDCSLGHIVTNPLQTKSSINRAYVSKSSTKGANGRNAGNITIYCREIENNMLYLQAKGSDGGNVFYPNATMEYPKYAKNTSKNIHTCQGDGFPSKRSDEYNLVKDHRIVGTVFTNPDCSSTVQKNGWGYENTDKSFGKVYSPSDKSNPKARFSDTYYTDSSKKGRFSYTDATPGKKGKMGKVVLNIEKNNNEIGSAVKWTYDGNEGGYYSRATTKTFQRKKEGNSEDSIFVATTMINDNLLTIKHYVDQDYQILKPYSTEIAPWCFHKVKNNSNYLGYITIGYNKCFKATEAEMGGQKFKEFKNKLDNYEYNKRKNYDFQQFTPNVQTYLPPYDLCEFIYNTVKNRHRDSKPQVNKDVAWLIEVSKAYKLEAKKSESSFEKVIFEKLKKIINEIYIVENDNAEYRDDYGNPYSYRPVLSFSAIVNYWSTNVDDDLYLYAYASDALQEENKRQKFLRNLSSIQGKLQKKITEDNSRLVQDQKKIDNLKNRSYKEKLRIDTLQKEFKDTEARLMKKAQSDAKWEKGARVGFKVLALGASAAATYFGGPEAGKLAYSMTDEIGKASSDAIWPKASPKNGNVLNTALQKVDLAGTIKAARNYKYKPPYTKSELAKRKAYKSFKLDTDFGELFDETKDMDNNSMLMDVPPGKKYYLEYKAKYDEQVKKEATIHAYTEAAVNATKESANILVSSEYLNNAIERVVRQSPELGNLGELIKWHADRNGDYITAYNKIISDKSKTMLSIYNNADRLHHLNKIAANKDKYYEPLIQSKLMGMRNESLERLKWMEYQLIKIYNYTTLSAYNNPSTNFRDLLSQRVSSETDLQMVARMKKAYDAKLRDIKFRLLQTANKNHEQDTKGRTISINKKNILRELNKEKAIKIDLYSDFSGEIIKPDENNIRIKEIKLVDLELEADGKPYFLNRGEEVYLKVALGNEGILRKDKDFFYFTEDENTEDIWKWTLGKKDSNSNQVTDQSKPSDDYSGIINLITTKDKLGKPISTSIFTYHPAWTDFYVEIDSRNTPSNLKVKNIEFKVMCDYEDVTNHNFAVLDLRMDKSLVSSHINIKDINGLDTIMNNRYTVLPVATEVSLEAVCKDVSTKFIEWDIHPNTLKLTKGTSKTDSKISFIMPLNKIGRAVNLRIFAKYGPDDYRSLFKRKKPLK